MNAHGRKRETLQSTEMDSVPGDREGQRVRFQGRTTTTAKRQQRLLLLKGSSSQFASDQIYHFRKTLKMDQVTQSHLLLPSMKWKFCICIAMKLSFNFTCLAGQVLVTKPRVSQPLGDKHWAPLWELQLLAHLFCARIKAADLSRCEDSHCTCPFQQGSEHFSVPWDLVWNQALNREAEDCSCLIVTQRSLQPREEKKRHRQDVFILFFLLAESCVPITQFRQVIIFLNVLLI